MAFGKVQESEEEKVKTTETTVGFSGTRKNNISKRQRITCFQAALPEFIEAAKKYQHYKAPDPEKFAHVTIPTSWLT